MGKIDQAVAEARTWLGTPYLHQGSLKHRGVDCLGLLRGVYREIYNRDTPDPIDYSPDWGEAEGEERMRAAAFKYLEPVPLSSMGFGCVILIRWKKGRIAKHSMIMTSDKTAIHAYNNSPVSEINLNKWWLSRVAYAFTWPEELE